MSINGMRSEVLSVLKRRFNKPDESYGISKHQFCFKNLQDNLYEPMSKKTEFEYGNGSGSELDGHMNSIRSSSAMTYNIFRNENAIFEGVEYEVFYEKKYRTLKRKGAGDSANLDALLVSKDGETVIACEMKMMEWFDDKKIGISSLYCKKEAYQKESSADVFLEVLKNLLKREGKKVRYDAMQMFKHSLALYNACASGEVAPKKLTLVNCVWEVAFASELSQEARELYTDCLNQEHEGFEWFYAAVQPMKKAFLDLGVDFDIKYYSVGDFLDKMTLGDKVRNYLEKYTK